MSFFLSHSDTVYAVYTVKTVYTVEIDQKRELVHFGKLTPPLARRIPKMQMPMFKNFTNENKTKISNNKQHMNAPQNGMTSGRNRVGNRLCSHAEKVQF